ncbi:MAG: AAA family ATPase [Lentisphaerae bacterium]|jgi:SpoVK/Ycf46/Vps4 family AAA+-type ATPase|nr:AAA family ATPase [Lentisphaerota bacterium]MBT4822130.1 AAA family ATPase [Lentisphaerota bacterium]MBT5610531.1 AAA family ATPase [Lentisphaerota bacterium]MBT7056086.1 AAA family ATPase [Lentisphaerota bacterium]MBT7842443.1 AAA family ATPase [Lentisphaerota bacterium]
MRQQLINYIRAGYPGIYVVSGEEARVEAELKGVAEDIGYRLFAWSILDGLVDTSDGTLHNAMDPQEVLTGIADLPERSLVLLRDLHQFLEDPNPIITRLLKNVMRVAKTEAKTLVVLGCRLMLPPELEREFVVVEFALPNRDELGVVLDNIAESAGREPRQDEERDLLLDAATGLTSIEAENAFALSVVEADGLNAAIVAREKAAAVKKNGLLEIVKTSPTLENIGGLDLLKGWLTQRQDAFGRMAQEYGLPSPKGLLIIGIPGTGKSLTAKATASVFQRPLLKLDAGRIYAGLVGQSEENLRSVIRTVEAIAPCVLWIDEIEKAFSGSKSSGTTDGGTASRVFGTFLSWMQERTSSVFIVATANDVNQLPPELLRKGRFDELFFVDIPDSGEREAIWRIQIAKYRRDPDQFDVQQLASISDGLTGSEIEQAFIDALYAAFSDDREPAPDTVQQVLSDLVPLSRLMNDQITGLRKWAQGRTRPATTQDVTQSRRRIQY